MRLSLLLACSFGFVTFTSVSAQSTKAPCDATIQNDSTRCVCDAEGCDGLVRGHSDIVYGQQNVFVDSVGWIVGIPRKVMIWDRRIDNHAVSSNTTSTVSEYLSDRGLHDVKLRVNQYDPIGEWKRLV